MTRMTREEAAEILDGRNIVDRAAYLEALEVAANALCESAALRADAPPPNGPLTMEELREMGLFEWLWVEVIHPTKSQLRREVESAYYQVFEDYTDGDAICCGWPGLIHDFAYEDYGKNWLAYRRKPEEEEARCLISTPKPSPPHRRRSPSPASAPPARTGTAASGAGSATGSTARTGRRDRAKPENVFRWQITNRLRIWRITWTFAKR